MCHPLYLSASPAWTLRIAQLQQCGLWSNRCWIHPFEMYSTLYPFEKYSTLLSASFIACAMILILSFHQFPRIGIGYFYLQALSIDKSRSMIYFKLKSLDKSSRCWQTEHMELRNSKLCKWNCADSLCCCQQPVFWWLNLKKLSWPGTVSRATGQVWSSSSKSNPR